MEIREQMKCLKYALVLIVLVTYSGKSLAQLGKRNFGLSIAGRVTLSNYSNNTVNYSVSYTHSNWSNHSISAGQTLEYNVGKDNQHGIFIWVNSSNGTHVDYYLKEQNKYYINWDSQKQIWNVYKYQ